MRFRLIDHEEEAEIVLFILIPHCPQCRERVVREILSDSYWEGVEIGYPGEQGTAVSLRYRKGKYPNVDYWELAQRAKARLDALGYRVM